MKELALALMTWINAQTGLPMPVDAPAVVRLSSCDIQREWRRDPAADCSTDASLRVVAMYRPLEGHGTIYLADTWRADSLVDLSTLVHELVHHMQSEDGLTPLTAHCVGQEIELPAYQAQMAFLKSAGLEDPLRAMGLNEIAFHFVIQCERGY